MIEIFVCRDRPLWSIQILRERNARADMIAQHQFLGSLFAWLGASRSYRVAVAYTQRACLSLKGMPLQRPHRRCSSCCSKQQHSSCRLVCCCCTAPPKQRLQQQRQHKRCCRKLSLLTQNLSLPWSSSSKNSSNSNPNHRSIRIPAAATAAMLPRLVPA